MDLDVEVEDLEELEDALKKGVRRGTSDTARWSVDEGRNKAQDLLRAGDSRGNRRIWKREVYHGFKHFIERKPHGYQANLFNTAPHVGIVELGRRPGETPPQVQDLMEWVVSKLNPAPDFDPDLVQYWEPELQALAATYGGGYVRTAFRVQDKIREEGIEGIRFMDRTENYLKQITPPIAHQKIESEIETQLRLHGI